MTRARILRVFNAAQVFMSRGVLLGHALLTTAWPAPLMMIQTRHHPAQTAVPERMCLLAHPDYATRSLVLLGRQTTTAIQRRCVWDVGADIMYRLALLGLVAGLHAKEEQQTMTATQQHPAFSAPLAPMLVLHHTVPAHCV